MTPQPEYILLRSTGALLEDPVPNTAWLGLYRNNGTDDNGGYAVWERAGSFVPMYVYKNQINGMVRGKYTYK